MNMQLSPLDPVVGQITTAPRVSSRSTLFTKPAVLNNEKRVILAFRFVVLFAAFAFLYSLPADVHIPWQFYFVMMLFLMSNFVFFFEGTETFNTRRAQMFIFAFDIGMLTILMIFLGLTNKEFYLVFFLTIFVSALSKRMIHALTISLVMSGLYVVFSVHGAADVELASTGFLVRVVLFFVVSSFVGHISEVAEAGKRRVEELNDIKRRTESMAMEHHKMAAVGLLAAGVAHEFNNLLAGIKGYADLAKMGAIEQEELVEVVTRQCAQASGIVRDLLSFSRKRGGHPEPQDVSEAVDQVLRLVHKELDVREIRIEKAYIDVPKVSVEPGVIERVTMNLVQNAITAMQDGGVLRVSIDRAGDSVFIVIRDDGCGMGEELLARVFDPFVSTKSAAEGEVVHASGLGLAVTKHLVEKCGGELELESLPGKGTTVTVRLPIHSADAAGDADGSSPDAGAARQARPGDATAALTERELATA